MSSMALLPPGILAFWEWAVTRLLDVARLVLLMIGFGDQWRVAFGGLPQMAFGTAGAAIAKAVVLAVRIRVHMVVADAKV